MHISSHGSAVELSPIILAEFCATCFASTQAVFSLQAGAAPSFQMGVVPASRAATLGGPRPFEVHSMSHGVPPVHHRDDFNVTYNTHSAIQPSVLPLGGAASHQDGASDADIRAILSPELKAIAATIRVSQRSRLPAEAVKLMRAWLVLNDSSPYPDACAKRVFAAVTGMLFFCRRGAACRCDQRAFFHLQASASTR